MNKYGIPLDEYRDNQFKCNTLLSSNLKRGALGLMLGAGVSYDLKLPSWKTLVERCINEVSPGIIIRSDINNYELKTLSNKISHGRSTTDYHLIVKNKLYEGLVFNFEFAKKDLLIALTSLMVGKTRGNVNHIITYNFDSVLEWYLQINGLKVNVSNKNDLLLQNKDVEITHLHGYLPFDNSLGENSESLVFTKEEFEDRNVQYNYWKVVMQDFYRGHLFLTIGLCVNSIIDDICPFLRDLNSWYTSESILRDFPYGIAYITPNSNTEEDREQKDNLIKHGIIPCTIEISKIPDAIFEIAQNALRIS